LKPRTPRGAKVPKTNVVSINGVAPPVALVDDEVVEKLEELLVKAKAGQLIGMVYGMVSPQASVGTGWVGNARSHDMLAAASMLFHRLAREAVDAAK
jgi:pyruvoyl-dependent arginine decarboxylase (PvlArgDC)